ncbi:MAG: hypothetical protein K2M97_00720 [Muribaculaceae bacterium]|nr:hypothetical protein [Muribaculaceae bacterium]
MTDNATITTSLHRISSHRYMTTVGEEWFARYWWVLVLPVGICLAIGITVDAAFTFVAFIILCLVIPPAMMMLYYNYALTPEASAAVRPHTLSVSPAEGLDIEFAPDAESGRSFDPIHVDWNEVSHVDVRSHDVVISLARRPYRYLIIPYSALDPDEGSEAVARLHELLHKSGKYNPVTL